METAIVWFRQDLRLTDNPALFHAAKENKTLIPLYILDESLPWSLGQAQKWWLHHSLSALEKQFEKLGSKLVLRRGDARNILLAYCKEQSVSTVYWNRCYQPDTIARDTKIKTALKELGITVKSYNGSLLHEPSTIKNKQGSYFKIFTPFWNHCSALSINPDVLPAPKIKLNKPAEGDALTAWKLLPTQPNWAGGFSSIWQPGELSAQKKLRHFLTQKLIHYSTYRDFPAHDVTSRLSPHLHFGEISPNQIWHAVKLAEIQDKKRLPNCEQFLRELGWREFSYHLLYHFPQLPEENFQPKFNRFPWLYDKKLLTRWQKGETGYPIVDAGMRELWHTGYMHNRVRMIVASFLTKHLLIDWREGAKWFWDTLLDADLANNAMNWQWVAGCGVDAAPYYRLFNPILQAKKFDAQGDYIRRWVPEEESKRKPIVDHEFARKRALEIYRINIQGNTYE